MEQGFQERDVRGEEIASTGGIKPVNNRHTARGIQKLGSCKNALGQHGFATSGLPFNPEYPPVARVPSQITFMRRNPFGCFWLRIRDLVLPLILALDFQTVETIYRLVLVQAEGVDILRRMIVGYCT